MEEKEESKHMIEKRNQEAVAPVGCCPELATLDSERLRRAYNFCAEIFVRHLTSTTRSNCWSPPRLRSSDIDLYQNG